MIVPIIVFLSLQRYFVRGHDRRRGQGLSGRPVRAGGDPRTGRDGMTASRRVPVDPRHAVVYEHGWQSWSPTAAYRLDERPARPVSDAAPGRQLPARTATAPADGVRGRGPARRRPRHRRRRARLRRRRRPTGRSRRSGRRPTGTPWSSRADGAVAASPCVDGGPRATALAPVGRRLRRRGAGVGAVRGRRRRRGAPGTTTSSGSPRTTSRRTCGRSTTSGSTSTSCRSTTATRPRSATGCRCPTGSRRSTTSSTGSAAPAAAPGSGSRRSSSGSGRCSPREHPDWLVGGADPGTGLGTSTSRALDATHPGAEAYLREVFGTLRDLGIDYFKIDFLFAGAMEGRRARAGRDRRRGLPARAAGDPRGDRAGRLPAGLRRADPAQRRAGRRHARRPGHRATTTSRSTATSPSPPSGPPRRTAAGGRGSTAGSGSTTPTAWSPAPHVERREEWADVVEQLQRAAGQQRPAAGARRLGPGDHPPAAAAGLTTPFVDALNPRAP